MSVPRHRMRKQGFDKLSPSGIGVDFIDFLRLP
jgi:hypothetical protein